jgi:type IV pilus assembly protein PilM
MHTSSHFYKDKPLFGLDIGFSSVKVIQLEPHGKKQKVVGYGIGKFDSKAVKDGVIVDYELIAHSIKELFEKNIIGRINTRRVAITVPATRTFTRTMTLPPLDDSELEEAVRLEAEQYIPMPLDDLYLDYSVIRKDDKGVELLAVAAPKNLIDSNVALAEILGLEPIAFDTSILAAGRLFEKQDIHNDIPAVLIDFGSVSSDITVHDKTVIVTGTISSGGDTFTEQISEKLNISHAEAHVVKTKYGLGKSKKQKEITEALKPSLDNLVKEVQRMIRYHEERSGSKQKIGQVITMGGGANMPGLSDFLTSAMRIPVRMCDPWESLEFNKLQPPSPLEKSMYVTVAGLSLISPKELFA